MEKETEQNGPGIDEELKQADGFHEIVGQRHIAGTSSIVVEQPEPGKRNLGDRVKRSTSTENSFIQRHVHT
ncbi:unnamed protein product, partial [Allacma fusca]